MHCRGGSSSSSRGGSRSQRAGEGREGAVEISSQAIRHRRRVEKTEMREEATSQAREVAR